MISLCQASRDSLVASSHIAKSCEDSWIYCCPGHNCKVENFFFICVLCLTETCLPNVGTTLCSLLRLCPSYNWCWNHCNNFFKPFLFCSFFFFSDKEISKLTCFSIEQEIFLLYFLIHRLSFLNSFVQGRKLKNFPSKTPIWLFYLIFGRGG